MTYRFTSAARAKLLKLLNSVDETLQMEVTGGNEDLDYLDSVFNDLADLHHIVHGIETVADDPQT